jgi:glycosyltransferase involved in cell wall biosynthesis
MTKPVKILIVTPAKNEAQNILRLADMIHNQSTSIEFSWILVVDKSSDNSLEVAANLKPRFPFRVIEYKSSGKLISGGAFETWRFGVLEGLNLFPETNFAMKLDADVVLRDDYFEELFQDIPSDLAILGGVIEGEGREQREYVPGPVKLYSIKALELVLTLPMMPGLDVVDEVLCKMNGLRVLVVPSARFKMNRAIGASQGGLHGRRRNGLVCRWTGYSFLYFFFHFTRYLFRDPKFLGSIWMLWGFIFAGVGPFDKNIKKFHRKMQYDRLYRIMKSPFRTVKKIYGLRDENSR